MNGGRLYPTLKQCSEGRVTTTMPESREYKLVNYMTLVKELMTGRDDGLPDGVLSVRSRNTSMRLGRGLNSMRRKNLVYQFAEGATRLHIRGVDLMANSCCLVLERDHGESALRLCSQGPELQSNCIADKAGKAIKTKQKNKKKGGGCPWTGREHMRVQDGGREGKFDAGKARRRAVYSLIEGVSISTDGAMMYGRQLAYEGWYNICDGFRA